MQTGSSRHSTLAAVVSVVSLAEENCHDDRMESLGVDECRGEQREI